ncbi:hypothetical protein ACQPZ2_24025 [Nocardia pseudovaccinii]|uniref:hypothetical protein n=1 Tax=Nocardia pseudovaccinii TaxID=189540 RepID=UPI003D8E8431
MPVVLALLLILPLLAGAAYTLADRDRDSSSRPTVAVVIGQADQQPKPGAGATKFVEMLSATADFTWQSRSTDDAQRALTSGSVLAAVVVPATLGSSSGAAQQISVLASRTESDPIAIARLVGLVSSSGSAVTTGEVSTSVSKARKDLNLASLTATGIKGAVSQADTTFSQALGTVDQLITQAEPLIDSATTLLAGIRDNTAVVHDIAAQLETLSTSMRGVDLTLADIQRGVALADQSSRSAADFVRQTAAVRAQLSAMIRPILDALNAAGLPDQGLIDQLARVLTTVDGSSDQQVSNGVDAVHQASEQLAEQLADLSGLVGAPVQPEMQVADILDLAVERLGSIETLLNQGDATISQVTTQLNQAKEQLPGIQSTVRSQLDQFKQVSAQLVDSLDRGVRELPAQTGPAPTGNSVSVADSSSLGSDAGGHPATRTALLLITGALLIAAVYSALKDRVHVGWFTPAKVTVLSTVGLIAGAAAILGMSTHRVLLTVLVALSAFALVGAAVALERLFGRWGLAVMAAVVAAAALIGTTGTHQDPSGRAIRRLLPTDYVISSLKEAATAGFSSQLILPMAVLSALAVVSAVAVIVTDAGRRRVQGTE